MIIVLFLSMFMLSTSFYIYVKHIISKHIINHTDVKYIIIKHIKHIYKLNAFPGNFSNRMKPAPRNL